MNDQVLRKASNKEIIEYITYIYEKYRKVNRTDKATVIIVDFLQQLIEARPGNIDEHLQQYIRFIGVSLKIPQHIIDALINASNGQESLKGRDLLNEDKYLMPKNMVSEAAGGGRRRRRSTKRRKNSRKNRKSLRRRRRV